jgi:hypothetical protein
MSQRTGMTAATFAKLAGLSKGQVVYYCQKGRIDGAKFDRITWQWRIYPPARLLTGSRL